MSNELKMWQRVAYLPLGGLLWLLSQLPLEALYLVADFIAMLAHRVVKYRLRVVRHNIRDSFPQKSEEELRRIESQFYHHLANVFVETIKVPGMSAEQMKRRMRFEDAELIDRLFDEGKSIIIYTSHFANWEWIPSIALWCRHKEAVYAHVYKPLSNKWFDRYFLKIRGVYNFSIPMNRVLRQMVEWRKDGVQSIVGFLSDQRPRRSTSTVDVDFMGRPTKFIAGTEEIARKFGLAVLFFDTRCDKRGHYVSTIRLVAEDASALEFGEVTRRYAAMLEQSIHATPGAYLWSHNRWSLKKNELK